MPGTFTIYDSAFPSKQADVSTPARRAAVHLENSIRNDALETGAFIARDGSVVVQKTGAPNHVRFNRHELSGTNGTLFTHNHPKDETFSREDIIAAIESQLVELRAVGPMLRHIMQAPGGWPSLTAFDRAIKGAVTIAQQRTTAQINAGNLDARDAHREVCHQMWREVSNSLSLRYEREKS